LTTEEGQAEIKQLVEDFQPEVLVLDPWQSFITGTDENSFKEVSTATRFLDRLIEQYRLTIMIAVHQGKNAKKGARGHSSLAGWRDTRFALKRQQHKLEVRVDPRWGKAITLALTFRHETLWTEVPQWSKQAEAIRKLVIANGGELSREQVGLGLNLEGSSLRMALKRAHEDNAIHLEGDIVKLPPIVSHATSPNHPE
jgi:hypothetical protein